jgi:hypothetical protein
MTKKVCVCVCAMFFLLVKFYDTTLLAKQTGVLDGSK